jgi:hypothetical protein
VRSPAATEQQCRPTGRRAGADHLEHNNAALPVQADNPYWTENGAVTVEDPDHWRVVLMPRSLA